MRFSPSVVAAHVGSDHYDTAIRVPPSPPEPANLAARASAQLKQALPDYDVAAVDPTTLTIGENGQPLFRINLFRVAHVCTVAPSQCDYTLGSFTGRVAQLVLEGRTRYRASMLRAVIRAASYVHGLESGTASGPATALITRPFAGDITLVCEFDLPSSTVPASASHVQALGVDPARAIRLCKKNMAANLPPLGPQLQTLPRRGLGELRGDGYTSSQFIFPRRWRAFAAKYPGGIIAAVPADNLVLYARNDDSVDVGALLAVAKRDEQEAERPISHMIFRWTARGWLPVAQ